MTGRTKKFLFALMIVFMLASGFGCATASVGFGYHVPVTPHVGNGIYFGLGF